MDTSLLRPIRNFLGLRLSDVSRATGVAVNRLSEAERGLAQLRPDDLAAVRDFLRDRLISEFDDDMPDFARALMSAGANSHEHK